MNYRDKIEIDLSDLIHYILRKWKSVIVCMLFCAILGSIYGYVVPEKSKKVSYDETSSASVEDFSQYSLSELAGKLSATEQDEVHMALQSYYDYKHTYDSMQTYSNNSLLNNMEAQRAPTYLVVYSISDYKGFDEVLVSDTTVINNIVSLYSNAITNKPVIDEIRSAIGRDLEDSYIVELYSLVKADLSLMKLYVHGANQEESEKIAHILENTIESYSEYVKTISGHNLVKADESYYESYNWDIVNLQKQQSDSMVSIEKTMLQIGNSFNLMQQAYYDALLDAAADYIGENGIIDIQSMVNAEIGDHVEEIAISKKRVGWYGIIGALLGIFIAVVWHVVVYMFSAQLRTKSDLADAFGLPILGELRSVEYKGIFGGIDRFIDNLFWKKDIIIPEEQLKRIALVVDVDAKRDDLKKIYLTSANSSDIVENWKNSIAESIGSGGACYEIKQGSSPIANYASLNELSSSDAVVLVEKLGVTKYKDISEVIRMCSQIRTKILGTVIIY